jgi:hypothetical protein
MGDFLDQNHLEREILQLKNPGLVLEEFDYKPPEIDRIPP